MREFDYAARLDLPVFAFATGVMALVGLGFGLLPAARASRTDLRGAISVTWRGATSIAMRVVCWALSSSSSSHRAALLTASVTATQFFRKLIEEPWGFETKDRLASTSRFPIDFSPPRPPNKTRSRARSHNYAHCPCRIRHRRFAIADGRIVDVDAVQRGRCIRS